MNIEKFREDLRSRLSGGVSQVELERLSGVRQATISKIANSTWNDIKLTTVIALWPHVYVGCEFPNLPLRSSHEN